jgi:1-acyl-sn-glycerol-3-phosphate acyltransferase
MAAPDLQRYHDATRRAGPGLTQRNTRRFMRAALAPFRPRAEGLENIPDGPVILAPNHGSYWDHFFLGIFVQRPISYMTAAEFFPNRVLGGFLQRAGSFPVCRGARDAEALATAAAVLQRGGLIVIYPEGGVCKRGEISERPRPGVGTLALRNGAPVVPVAIHPATRLHKWGFLKLPRIAVRFGEPLTHIVETSTDRDRDQEAADRIWERIVALYQHDANSRRNGHHNGDQVALERESTEASATSRRY